MELKGEIIALIHYVLVGLVVAVERMAIPVEVEAVVATLAVLVEDMIVITVMVGVADLTIMVAIKVMKQVYGMIMEKLL